VEPRQDETMLLYYVPFVVVVSVDHHLTGMGLFTRMRRVALSVPPELIP
jgi:hypothetical protein